jgi:hypothetical protein
MPYTHEHGSYYLIENGNIRLMTDQVAVAFAEKDLNILKHGSPEAVHKWWDARRPSAELLFGPVSIATFPRGFPVDHINRIIEHRRLNASSLVQLEHERRE